MNNSNIDEKIKEIKEKLKGAQNDVAVLENVFRGKTAFVVSAGPSAKGWEQVLGELEG
jgi:hypothetical protein